MLNKYNLGDRVRTKIHYKNDKRTEVDALIYGMEIIDAHGNIRYKILFESDALEKKQGCTGSSGYVDQEDIIGLCSQNKDSIGIMEEI